MYIDETRHKGSIILDLMIERLEDLYKLDLIEKLKPTLTKDGDQFCYLYGELPNDCVIGFGDTVGLAMNDFYVNFHGFKAKNMKK